MICTRDIPKMPGNGRERTLLFIHETLISTSQVEIFRLRSFLEHRSLRRILRSFIIGLRYWILGHPIPLQTLLFIDAAYSRKLWEIVARHRPDVIYFDGVRSGYYALELSDQFDGMRLVADFDDLMSRRIKTRIEMGQPMSLGYLNTLVPDWFSRRLMGGILKRLLSRYEYKALIALESRISKTCSETVLVSSKDAEVLKTLEPKANVVVIPPYVEKRRPFMELSEIKTFVCLGSDSFLQNHMTIEHLLGLWKSLQPSIPLNIYGSMTHQYPPIHGVTFRGFEPNIEKVYAPGSVLLATAFVPGGVKTKVLDAICYGIVPVGNDITFEGISADFGGLSISEQEMVTLIMDPQSWIDRLNDAGHRFHNTIFQNHSTEVVANKWRSLMN